MASSGAQVFSTIARMLSGPIAFAVSSASSHFLISHGVNRIGWRLASEMLGTTGGGQDGSSARHFWLKIAANTSALSFALMCWAPPSLRMGIFVEPPPPVSCLIVHHHSGLDVEGLQSLDLIRWLWDRLALSITCCFSIWHASSPVWYLHLVDTLFLGMPGAAPGMPSCTLHCNHSSFPLTPDNLSAPGLIPWLDGND